MDGSGIPMAARSLLPGAWLNYTMEGKQSNGIGTWEEGDTRSDLDSSDTSTRFGLRLGKHCALFFTARLAGFRVPFCPFRRSIYRFAAMPGQPFAHLAHYRCIDRNAVYNELALGKCGEFIKHSAAGAF